MKVMVSTIYNIFCKKRCLRAKGFTLIELLAVLSIISIITFLLLVQQSKFDSSTVLRSLAYNVAVSIRQAQVYGISVREDALGTSNFAQSYGLYFDPTANPQNYILFADSNSNGSYDSGEEVSVFKLNSTYSISEACAIKSDGTKRCTGGDDSSGTKSINTLSVLFRRPNPDALFYVSPLIAIDLDANGNTTYTGAYVQVRSINGSTRGVHVYSTGQVSVDSVNPSTPI